MPNTVANSVELYAAMAAYRAHLQAERRLRESGLTAEQWATLSDRSWGRLREFRAIVRGLIGAKAAKGDGDAYSEFLASQAASLTEPTIPAVEAAQDGASEAQEPATADDDGPPVGRFTGDEDGRLSPRARALEMAD